jgi:hypothetical protein
MKLKEKEKNDKIYKDLSVESETPLNLMAFFWVFLSSLARHGLSLLSSSLQWIFSAPLMVS